MAGYYKVRLDCVQCGEPFWGTRRGRCCNAACRSRHWRAKRILGRAPNGLTTYCQAVLDRVAKSPDSYAKLLPLLFRATAAELRRRGWDPLELLHSVPDDPVSSDDQGPDGTIPARKWLYPPEEEIKKLEQVIVARAREGRSYAWHFNRRNALLAILAGRREAVPAKGLTERG